ncbi:MAG: class I SAM-dependent methyltransferase [Lutibacter sp.]|jgi:SAM-dependent methyltransferase|nr:class I SAM-dependent methyltransferase [Lutibacter sp.]
MNCPVCASDTAIFARIKARTYYLCNTCKAVCLDRNNYLTAEAEKQRYLEHNNDVDDPGYQEFVRPIVSFVKENFTPGDLGLDYGCGPGPVISKLLGDDGYKLNLYDPFFNPDSECLESHYSYIVCCEVMEHFHQPKEAFQRLGELLKPGGVLICMTDLFGPQIDFDRWYYKNDPTHVVFYQTNSLAYIQKNCGFSKLRVDQRRIVFTK